MKIIFAGTPEFSVGVLTALIKAGHNIVGVYCQPDRPKGRGRTLTPCPVKVKALEHNLLILQPESFKDKDAQTELKNLNAAIMIVVAYGQILPKEVLQMPKYGCLNIHASLLPRWRGAAPIQRAIFAGDKTTGIGIMQMNEGLDTGAILLEETCEITDTDTAQSLHDKLASLGANAIITALKELENLSPTPQNEANITYAKKLKKDEAWINWTQSATQINRQIRAFNPYPIAQTNATSDKFNDKTLRILSATVINNNHNHQPGEIIKHDKKECLVATGDGTLSLKTVQLSGKKALNIKDFSNAYTLTTLK
ncbi:methionyl-tRNA formyltransferase [Bathymodiolus thermophilus thioautotrophic gill symbiont]|uniref:Methionyl-tRNA formyltransferase n=1 Tax=Bathymodiolus thermophilus thioautotrophic gill symbiont TaxID=2360 RepID=A0A3G3IKY3_9GAMM|nr:methionyl-tRNA formyltransferase [Bathymodiolus thermophilus thioautotrophic gill symbiont]AYQ56244.1 methionyl-tRNA formyltransferase [Bathymodiolus thermophilus thioautotrophic gill symbiont]